MDNNLEVKIPDYIDNMNQDYIKEINGVKVNTNTGEVIEYSMEDLIEGKSGTPQYCGVPNDPTLLNSLKEYEEKAEKEIKVDTEYQGIIKSVLYRYKSPYSNIVVKFEVNGIEYEDSYSIQGGQYDKFYFEKLMNFLKSGEIVLTDLDFSNLLALANSLDVLLREAKVLVRAYKTDSGYLKFNNSLISKYDSINKKMN